MAKVNGGNVWKQLKVIGKEIGIKEVVLGRVYDRIEAEIGDNVEAPVILDYTYKGGVLILTMDDADQYVTLKYTVG